MPEVSGGRRRGAGLGGGGEWGGDFSTAASEDPVADTKGLNWALDLGVLFSHMKLSSQ